VLVWALLYFPRGDGLGSTFDVRIAEMQTQLDHLREDAGNQPGGEQKEQQKELEDKINDLHGEGKRQSLLGRMGQMIEPAVRPLGWDWKIGMAALASFPAREVVVGTLGIIYNLGKVDSDEIRDAADPGDTELSKALQDAKWDDEPTRQVFSVPVAL